MSNPLPAETAEVFESTKAIFSTSIFCASLFYGPAVHNEKMKRLEDLQVGQISMGLPVKMPSGFGALKE